MTFSVEAALDRHVLRLEEPREPDGYWHPSSISGCARRAMYDYLGTEKTNPHNVRASRVFRMGHIIHEFVQTAITEDPSVAEFYPEIAVTSARYRITGHADGLIRYVDDTWELLEIKSINSNAFKYGDLPKADHQEQAFIYMKLLREEGGTFQPEPDYTYEERLLALGEDLDRARIAYVSKDDMLVGEFVVPWSAKQDDQFMAKLDTLEENLSDGTLPDRLPLTVDKNGRVKLAWNCTYCPYKDLCWEPGTTRETQT